MRSTHLPPLASLFAAVDEAQAPAPTSPVQAYDLLAQTQARYVAVVAEARTIETFPAFDLDLPAFDPTLLREAADRLDEGLYARGGDARSDDWVRARVRAGAYDALLLELYDLAVSWSKLVRFVGRVAQGQRPVYPFNATHVDVHVGTVTDLVAVATALADLRS